MKKTTIVLAYCFYGLPCAVGQLPPIPDATAPNTKPQPKLQVNQRTIDLGTILDGERPLVTWTLKNVGTADLIIEKTRASCGCTVVKLEEDEKVIPPGGTLDLKAEFNSEGRRGVQNKSITVHSNDPAEPAMKLSFTATLKALYRIKPTKLVNLRSVRRGETVSQTIEISPAGGHRKVELISIETPEQSMIHVTHEPFNGAEGLGIRVRISIDKYVALGTLISNVRLKFSVDGIERERVLPIRGQVVGELTWTPRIVDATRKNSPRGQRFAPITIQSTNKVDFDILSTNAGPYLDVAVDAAEKRRSKSRYTIVLTLRDDAPPGPFGASLEIRTTLPDQPVVRIPVFGIVAAPIEVEPPIVLLRQDGTPAGTHRRIKLQVLPRVALDITSVTCNHDAVQVTIDYEASARYRHIRFLDIKLTGVVPPGTHQAVVHVATRTQGVDSFEIPVIIEVPGDKG